MNAHLDTPALFSDDADWLNLVTRERGRDLRSVDLAVPDMRCSACAARIEAAANVAGVESVAINPARHQVAIEYRPSTVRLGEIVSAIEDAGYTPTFTAAPDADERLVKERRRQLKRIGVAGIAMVQVMMYSVALYAGSFQGMDPLYVSFFRWTALVFTTPVVLYSAAPFFTNAWHSVRGWASKAGVRAGLAMDVPVALAIGSAYLVSVHATVTGGGETYFDSVTMFTFFLLGARFLEQGLRHRLSGYDTVLGMLPEEALRLVESNGVRHQERIDARRIVSGDRLRVIPGSRIPADGVIVEGETECDESALTGEAAWIAKRPGDNVFAGTVNVAQAIDIEASSSGNATRIASIAQLANRAALDRPAIVDATDTVARYFVVCVLALAAGAFVVWSFVDPSVALTATFATLVVSCPCALSLATPAAITAATTALRRVGFVVTRAHVLERLATATRVVFDKTGTLTSGVPQLCRTTVHAALDARTCLAIAAALETRANHPLARAFLAAANGSNGREARSVTVVAGEGIEGTVDGTTYRLGSAAFCSLAEKTADGLKNVYLASDGKRLATFEFSETLRRGASETISALEQLGLSAELLSGDQDGPSRQIAAQLNNLPVTASASPEAKHQHILRLHDAGHRVVMLGDGVNDVPSLAAATVSIAPLEATDVAKQQSDAVLLSRSLAPLAVAFRIARRTRRIIRQNLTWALGYNVITIPLAALGLIPPWLAALGMSASSLIVTVNAARLARTKPVLEA